MDEIGDEFDDESGNDEFLEEPPELTSESDEPDEFDDDIPEAFSEPDEFDNDIPEVFSEPDEFDDILDDTIHDKEVDERAEEDQDSGDVGNVVENENIGPQSTSTVLTSEIEEIESNMEHQEQEEEIEIRPEEYQGDTEPIVNTDESEFIKDIEELAEYARETKGEDDSVEPQAEQENAAYYAEQYYEKIKEKEAINEQNNKEEQETEELMQEVAEELKGDQESNYKSDEIEEEATIEASKEITSTEEFEYLWGVRDKLDQEGKSPEEIEEVMHEAEEMYETLKNAEKLYEEQELEKLKLVDHEDEATEEDLKEELDRVDLVEQAIELEEGLFQQGEPQEEIDARVEESIENTKFEESLEEIIEAQELEKLKLVDHEDEATEEDLKEELDRIDLLEQAVELEEILFQQGESQEEIDARVEESIEPTKFGESLKEMIEPEQESIVNKKLKKLDLEINEQNSNENVENEENLEVLKPELDAMESESDEEEDERLQELYRQETNRRPIYARKKTKSYSQWLEQRELGAEKIKNSKSESEKIKEIEEEDWKTTLKQWIREASEEECNAELKSELKKALESYDEFEDLTRKFLELYEKSQHKKLTEKEENRIKSLTERLQELGPNQLELLANIRAFKDYFYNHLWEVMNRFFVIRVRSKFFKHVSQKYKELRKEQKNEKIKYSLIIKQENDLHKRIFKYGESLHQGIVCIYYICEIFPKNREIDKKYFSGSELNYILNKHTQFFYTINKNLKDKDLIRYYGSITRKKKSNEMIYIITEKGIEFTEEIIKIKRRDFPILFDELIATLEKRYIEYNKDLINSEKKNKIRSHEDINKELRKIARHNNVELVDSYRSDRLDINFRCKKCKKEFLDIYKNIKRRQPPKLFCPFCFPELIKNPSISKKLKEQITKYSLNKLERIIINDLSEVEILENIKTIKESVFEQIESQLSCKNSEFKRFLKKYIANIVWFLTKIKLLSETNQKINISNVAKETHDKSLTSLNQWYKIVKEIVRHLRDILGFSIRTTHQDPLLIPESSRNGIRSFKTYYKLIKGSDKKGITITYLDIDYKTEIKIHYDGKCQGLDEYCPFNIDHKFLPSLSHHHRLEGYNKIITEKDYEYIQPSKIFRHSLHRALELLQTQIGGFDLMCINCHSIKHSIRYTFPPIFNFLKSLTLEDIKENVSDVFNEVNILANKFLEQNKERYRITKNNTIAKIKIDIKRSIIGFVKKKYVIEYLFGANYICPVCQKANINDHLTCFEAHHTNLDLFEKIEKIEFGKEYKRKPIPWLIKNLIIQECIYLCSNCHAMIKATIYRDYILIILENQKEAFFVNNFYKLLDTQIAVKRNIILQWKIQLKDRSLNFANPLRLIFKMGEALDQKVVCIYYICEEFSRDTKKHFFTASVLNFILNKFHTHFNNYKNQLISDGYIQYVKGRHQFNQKFFAITPKGIEKAKEIIKKKKNEFSEEFNMLILAWKDRYIEYHNSS